MAATAVRSVLRSPSVRYVASRAASGGGASRPSFFRLPKPKPSATTRFLWSPVEASFCVESLMPLHSATASALMTSMLSVSCRGYGWLSEAGADDV